LTSIKNLIARSLSILRWTVRSTAVNLL